MGIEGQGSRGVVMRRQTEHIIQRFDRDETTVNDDGVLIPEKEELQYAFLHHQSVSDKLLNEPGSQRTRNDRSGWSLSEEKISNGNKITIDEEIFTVNNIRSFAGHSEFDLIRSGEQNNRAE